jgi:hypothetical protein
MATTKLIGGKRYQFALPVAALKINEDIQALERILRELKGIDPVNISKSSMGPEILKMLKTMTLACQRYASLKLRNDYLKRF